MEPILDERSVRPSDSGTVRDRLMELAKILREMDRHRLCRVLRSVREVLGLDIGNRRTLRSWCSDLGVDRDARRLIAIRLGKAPFIDGPGGLLTKVEGNRAVQGTADGREVFGLAYAALTEQAAVALPSGKTYDTTSEDAIDVNLLWILENGITEYGETRKVPYFRTHLSVQPRRQWLEDRVNQTISTGQTLVNEGPRLFPNTRFGARAEQQLAALKGNEPYFHQVIRHLRALDRGVFSWNEDFFRPDGALCWSPESKSTLEHKDFGPMRDFPTPPKFEPERWSLHSKLTGRTSG